MAIRDEQDMNRETDGLWIEKYREKSALKLVFSVLIRASKRWC